MKVVKRQSQKTYTSSKSGKECHYYNYYLQLDNGKRVQIKCAYSQDYAVLDCVCEYEGKKEELPF